MLTTHLNFLKDTLQFENFDFQFLKSKIKKSLTRLFLTVLTRAQHTPGTVPTAAL